MAQKKKPLDFKIPSTKRELLEQRQALLDDLFASYREKFGRDPDPKMTLGQVLEATGGPSEAEAVEFMKQQGVPPQLVYAFQKSGVLLCEYNRDLLPPEAVKQFEDAVQEYFDQHQ